MEGQTDFAALPPLEAMLGDELRLDEFDPRIRDQVNDYDRVEALSEFTDEAERALLPARIALMYASDMPPIQAAGFNQEQVVAHLRAHPRQLEVARDAIAQRQDLTREVYEWFGEVGLA